MRCNNDMLLYKNGLGVVLLTGVILLQRKHIHQEAWVEKDPVPVPAGLIFILLKMGIILFRIIGPNILDAIVEFLAVILH